HGEKVSQQYGISQLRKENKVLKNKTIFIGYAREDKEFGKRVEDLLSSRGANISSHGQGMTEDDQSYLYNIRDSIKKCDFAVLVKSQFSDKIGVWRDILGLIANHEIQNPEKEPFFYVLIADDSPYESYSYLFLKENRLWDIRLKPIQEKLFLFIYEALEIRDKRLNDSELNNEENLNTEKVKLIPEKFDWPRLKLTQGQRYWLGYLYSKFKKAEEVDLDKEIPFHWPKFGNEENPTNLDRLLVSGRELTLLGIWSVDKKSRLFQLFDDAIQGIKKLFLQKGGFTSITSADLRKISPHATSNEIWCVGRLIYSHGFLNGWGGNNTIDFDMHIDNSRRDKFRLYKGVEALVNSEVQERQNLEVEDENYPEEDYDESFENEIYRNATEIHLNERPSKIVLDTESLASDISNIIQRLPYQFGRMIGIFGAWGRGKSILLEEIWKQLDKSNSKWRSTSKWEKLFYRLKINRRESLNKETHYINIAFHAWKYQDTPASWAYLYECFADCYYRKPNHIWQFLGWFKYLSRIIKLNFFRIKPIPFLKAIGFISIGVFGIWALLLYKNTLEPELKIAIKILGGTAIGTMIVILFDRFIKSYSGKASDIISKYANRTSFAHHMGMQAEIQKELQLLLRIWLGSNDSKKHFKKRILLTVEDIDRCSEDKIMHTIDGLRVMLENPIVSKWVIILCAIDERVLSRAVYSKYKDLMNPEVIQPVQVHNYPSNLYNYNFNPQFSPYVEQSTELTDPDELQKLTGEYFDKLFILAIRLGKLSKKERVELIDSFIGPIQKDDFVPSSESNATYNNENSVLVSPEITTESSGESNDSNQRQKDQSESKAGKNTE
ncbi:MAG TPA: P-loop NTPase fold protein, partial [Bacteroidia bacterium]|nr:P-loop NTPase fold protein [Bacteroidia bacterium]